MTRTDRWLRVGVWAILIAAWCALFYSIGAVLYWIFFILR